jgi:hypothetical protein
MLVRASGQGQVRFGVMGARFLYRGGGAIYRVAATRKPIAAVEVAETGTAGAKVKERVPIRHDVAAGPCRGILPSRDFCPFVPFGQP